MINICTYNAPAGDSQNGRMDCGTNTSTELMMALYSFERGPFPFDMALYIYLCI